MLVVGFDLLGLAKIYQLITITLFILAFCSECSYVTVSTISCFLISIYGAAIADVTTEVIICSMLVFFYLYTVTVCLLSSLKKKRKTADENNLVTSRVTFNLFEIADAFAIYKNLNADTK